MTKEEAIEIIESRNFYCIECIDRSEECCKALEMAIEALSAEKTAECDNNHDCEHCDWTECPLEVEKETEGAK